MSRRSLDSSVAAVLHVLGTPALLLVLLLAVFLLGGAGPALLSVAPGEWLGGDGWYPSARAAEGSFQLAAMLVGTLAASAGAMLLAAPLGLLAAIFVRFHAPPALGRAFAGLLALLAGIPSVVYGFWGLVTLVPLVRHLGPPGPSLLAASLILALMVLPTVALLSEAALRGVPREQFQAAAALGLSQRRTIFGLALPAARAGLLVALLLAGARAIGETMAVLMVAGNVVAVPSSVLDPVRTLTAGIALELGYAQGAHRSALFVAALVLVALVATLVGAARMVGGERADG